MLERGTFSDSEVEKDRYYVMITNDHMRDRKSETGIILNVLLSLKFTLRL